MIAPENVTDPHSRHVLHAVGGRGRDVLDEVRSVTDERGRRYGPVDRHWARTIGALNALFGHKLSEPLVPSDWGIIMAVDKLAREMETPLRDNAVDIVGYIFKRTEFSAPPGAQGVPELDSRGGDRDREQDHPEDDC